MTLKELRKIITQDIYSQLGSDFDFIDTLIYKTEGNEILTGLFFEKSGLIKDGVYVYCFALPLMIKADDLSFNFGYRLKTNLGSDIWMLDKDNRSKTISELIPLVLNQNLLSNVSDSASFIEFFSKDVDNIRGMEAITFCCCWVDLNNYKSYLEKLKLFVAESDNLSWGWVKQILDTSVEMQKLTLNKFEKQLNEIVKSNVERVKKRWYL